ncbi:MAG: hypothetical protein LCH26_07560 [Proteobacteria bacterium]|nr:hypothetical protein [Pseudomonadota bacterium]
MKHALLLAAATILTLHTQGVLASSQDDQSSRDEVCEQLHLTGAQAGYDTRLRAGLVQAFWQQEAERRALSRVAHAQFDGDGVPIFSHGAGYVMGSEESRTYSTFGNTVHAAHSGFRTVISEPICRGDVFWEAECWEHKDRDSDMRQYTRGNWMADLIRDNSVALTQEDIDRMRTTVSAGKIVKSAQKRYAHAHGVPGTVASIFSNSMSKKDDLRRALSACVGDYLADRSLSENDFPAYDASELTDFLSALHHIGRERWSCDKYNETVREKRRFLHHKVKEGHTLDEAADLLFQDTMRHPNEEVTVFDARQFAHLPRSVRLRASLLKQDWPLKMEILSWVAGQEEDRALASLALLSTTAHQDTTRNFMQAAPAFDAAYLRRFVKIWYNLPPSCELMTVLQMGMLPRQDLKVIRGAADRRALLGSRGFLESSLVVRLLRNL